MTQGQDQVVKFVTRLCAAALIAGVLGLVFGFLAFGSEPIGAPMMISGAVLFAGSLISMSLFVTRGG